MPGQIGCAGAFSPIRVGLLALSDEACVRNGRVASILAYPQKAPAAGPVSVQIHGSIYRGKGANATGFGLWGQVSSGATVDFWSPVATSVPKWRKCAMKPRLFK